MFIAVPLAADIREAAGQARRPLAACGERLRWVEPQHLHLTLQFLGDITTAMVTQAVAAAEDTAAAETPFTITFAGLGAFPSAAAPRVVWVGVTEGVERLATLAGRLALALRTRRFSLEDRPFTPHLTLARVRGTGRPPDLRRGAEALGRVVLGGQRVAELIVVKSVLGSSAPTHTIVAAVPFEGAGTRAQGVQENRKQVDRTG
jgi:RNA 2',3'-cyclic 3'-phosphodiesterase